MRAKFVLFVASAASATILCSPFGAPGQSGLTPPTGYRQWFHVNSMTIDKSSPLSPQLEGLHNVYVNEKGLAALQSGDAYPDGTIFTDDIHEFAVSNGSYVEGNRKGIGVMVKDSKKYASTAGWGWQAWIGSDPKKPIVTNATTMCIQCHAQRKEHDYVFSSYIP
jgi:cytochrome P460